MPPANSASAHHHLNRSDACLNISESHAWMNLYLPRHITTAVQDSCTGYLQCNALLRLCALWHNLYSSYCLVYLVFLNITNTDNSNAPLNASSGGAFDPATMRVAPARHKATYKQDMIRVRSTNPQLASDSHEQTHTPVASGTPHDPYGHVHGNYAITRHFEMLTRTLSWIVWALLVMCLCKTASSQAIICGTAYECVNQSVVTSSDLLADGYKSNYNSALLQVSNLLCRASLSCARSGTLISTKLFAEASYSAAFVESVSGSYIYAHGYKALSHSTVSATTQIWCASFLACRYMQQHDVDTLWASGALSAANSILRSNSDTPTFLFYGDRSGYNALLFCEAHQSCNIWCYHNGCEQLFLVCSGTCNVGFRSDSSVAPRYADAAMTISGDEVDALLNAHWLYQIPDTDALCEELSDEMKRDDSQDAYGLTFDDSVLRNSTALCCRGAYACDQMQLAAAHSMDVVCSGTNSCRDSKVDLLYEGSLWCQANYACTDSIITLTNAHLFCYGGYSCYRATITAANGNVVCAGQMSCMYSDINVISDHMDDAPLEILFSGYESGLQSTVTIECVDSTQCVVRCQGYKACSFMTLSCAGDCLLYCNHDTECPYGWTSSPSTSPTYYPTSSTSSPSSSPTYYPTSSTSRPSASPTYYPIIDVLEEKALATTADTADTTDVLQEETLETSADTTDATTDTTDPASTFGQDDAATSTNNNDVSLFLWLALGVAILICVVSVYCLVMQCKQARHVAPVTGVHMKKGVCAEMHHATGSNNMEMQCTGNALQIEEVEEVSETGNVETHVQNDIGQFMDVANDMVIVGDDEKETVRGDVDTIYL